jgi:hypothetical protein
MSSVERDYETSAMFDLASFTRARLDALREPNPVERIRDIVAEAVRHGRCFALSS